MPGSIGARGAGLAARRCLILIGVLAGVAGPARDAFPEEGVGTVSFTVVYDNNPHDPRLRTAWGFACLVRCEAQTVLFDTGGDGSILLQNLASLALDYREIDAVVLSHAHSDHTGGLGALLDAFPAAAARPTVYVPAAFPGSFKRGVRSRTRLVEVTGPREIAGGIHTTGEVGAGLVEQALVVETREGTVVVTGCAHPGVVEMVRRAREQLEGPVAWVVGGFHLGGAPEARIAGIIQELRGLGVRKVAPCHCTGDRAREMFAAAFADAYAAAGAGWGISL